MRPEERDRSGGGHDKWKPYVRGIVPMVDAEREGEGELVNRVRALLTPRGYAPVRALQDKFCVRPPARGTAVSIMAAVIESFDRG